MYQAFTFLRTKVAWHWDIECIVAVGAAENAVQARRKKKECLMRSCKQIVCTQGLPKNWPEYFPMQLRNIYSIVQTDGSTHISLPMGGKKDKREDIFCIQNQPRLVKIWTKAILQHCDEINSVAFITCTRYPNTCIKRMELAS